MSKVYARIQYAQSLTVEMKPRNDSYASDSQYVRLEDRRRFSGLVQVYVGAFAISGYATAHYRNRYKPFNPLLGETYECLREDKGFRYISEQVGGLNLLSHSSADQVRLVLLCSD